MLSIQQIVDERASSIGYPPLGLKKSIFEVFTKEVSSWLEWRLNTMSVVVANRARFAVK
jgi:hypothetical protein